MTSKHAPDSVQSLIQPDPWWSPSTKGTPERGRLLWAFVPVVSHTPRTLVSKREDAKDHSRAEFVLEPMRASAARAARLPVAALPLDNGEVHAVYRAKRRPVVVLAVGPQVDPRTAGAAKGWQSAPMLLVAPYFGVEATGNRGGWPEEFVRRIRHLEYPSYLHDILPLPGATTSVLRLDQLQPIGNHFESYERTDWRLSDAALRHIDQQLQWLLSGQLAEDLEFMRSTLPTMDPQAAT